MKNKPIGLAHVGIPCSNLDASVAFYAEFGFETVTSGRNLSGYDVAIIRRGDCAIELYQCLDAAANDVAARKDGHVDHIAMVVEDVQAVYDECVEKGYEIVSDGIESIGVWAPKKCRYFFIVGPDRERIEFAQVSE